MEAISKHSPRTHNGPMYRTYGRISYPVAVYCTCCGKSSKVKSTVKHADPTQGGTRGFCLPVLADRHEHLCIPICTQKKQGLPIVLFCILKTYGCNLA